MKCCNERLKSLPFGGLYEVFNKATRLEATGRKMIHMEIGRPVADSPEFAKKAVQEALERGEVFYTDISGLAQLRQAICHREEKRWGLHYDPDTELCICTGASEGEMAIFSSLLDFGDELIVPGPYFSAYYDEAVIAGVKLVEVPVRLNGQTWEFESQELRKAVTPKTKMILINSPNNPAGYVLSEEKLKEIACIAKEFDLIVLSDECYESFVFEGEHHSIASFPDMRERTLVVKSTSKTYSMTGWRVGYVMGPAEMIKYINKVHQNMTVCCNSFTQWGVIEAMKHGEEFASGLCRSYLQNRDCAWEILSKIKGLKLAKPQGAFYLFPNVSAFGMSSADMCSYLLEKAGVVTVPGDTFGHTGDGFLRFSFCQELETVQEGCGKIRDALQSL